MKSIPTNYNGRFFRSRLEARWAVFFDYAGITYEYEPEGFENNGSRYLPDFYLPETYQRHSKGLFVEIKPSSFTSDSIAAADWFNDNLCLFKGQPIKCLWSNLDPSTGYEIARRGDIDFGWDDCIGFWLCEICETSKVEYQEGNYDYCPNCGTRGTGKNSILYLAAIEAQKENFDPRINKINGPSAY